MRVATRRKDRGFTLIELLVVIAIIAILAAILFPVFISARTRAKAANCSANMKQLGQAFQMYLDSYNDVWPSSHFGAHIWLLEPYIRQIRWSRNLTNVPKKPSLTVWLCPAAPNDMFYVVRPDWWDLAGAPLPWRKYGITDDRVKVFNSYVLNDDVTGRFPTYKYSKMRAPSHTVLLAETCYNTDRGGEAQFGYAATALHPTDEPDEVTGWLGLDAGAWCAEYSPLLNGVPSKSEVHPRHNGAANFLWADMHVTLEATVPDLTHWQIPYRGP